MQAPSLAALVAFASLAAALSAQDPELAVNNFFRVRSTGQHPGTGNYYPYSPTTPPGYASATPPGVAAGTRLWTYTPKFRYQAGQLGPNFLTISGITQSIYVGPAVASFPAPNHYQFKCGIAPTVPGTGAYQRQHAPTGADLFSVADAPTVIPNGPIWEISTTLATPVPMQDVELCFFLEYRGGEYWDDPLGGQTAGCDYQGGKGPGALAYCGYTTGSNPRTVVYSGEPDYRPKMGLLVKEPVLTATGYHANRYYTPRLTGEYYRGIAACAADYSTSTQGSLWFDVRAGGQFGSTGTAVVFANNGWFQGALPTPWGSLFLSPVDPYFDLFVGIPLTLSAGGTYSGESQAIAVPALGASARGNVLKVQAIVFNQGFTNLTLTGAAAILVE
ncbi:MAG: hypothetical protein IT458_15125 [Planctomycetes bacterium]|nr:hypothetical protein [Planctomycetota bacterium]